MAFDPKQLRMLKARLKPAHVRSREQDGRNFHYLEGWHVIAEANRIFGFGEWDRELVDAQCVYTRHSGSNFTAVHTCRVRIRVRTESGETIREGSGAGEGNATSPGQAHEFALKAAETDATKRALMTFGNAFGLSLYQVRDRWEPAHQTAGATAGRFQPGNRQDGSPHANSARHRIAPAPPPAEVTGSEARPRGSEPDPRADGSVSVSREANGNAVATANGDPATTATPPESAAIPESQTGNVPHRGGRKPVHHRIDKSELAIGEPKRVRNRNHLRFVARQLCLVCGRAGGQAHHLKFAQPSAIGRKVSDEFTVPLCKVHHRELHTFGDERVFWDRLEIDPLRVAEDLWARGPAGPGGIRPGPLVNGHSHGPQRGEPANASR